MRTTEISTILAAFLIALPLTAQDTTKSFYFPHKTGDMWEYFFYEGGPYGFPPDTLQNFTIFDSTDSQGIIYITQFGRAINPTTGTYFFDTTKYRIDAVENCVYGGEYGDSALIYKLNAKQGDKWIVYDFGGGSANNLAVVKNKWVTTVLGKHTRAMDIWYYSASDTADTLTWLDAGTVIIADGFGIIFRTVAETAIEIFLIGSVINDTLYGDTTLVSLKSEKNFLPSNIILKQNYPNPFNPSTTISFELYEPSKISLIIYDVLGKEVYKLIDNKEFNSGVHKAVWNGLNKDGNMAASGINFYRLITNQHSLSRSMILLK
jgi:hypothetical protein